MGTLNLKKVIEENRRNMQNTGGRQNKSVLLLGKMNQMSYKSPSKNGYQSIQDVYHSGQASQRRIPTSSYKTTGYPEEIESIRSRLRDNSLEMVRHEATLTLSHLEYGRTKSHAETIGEKILRTIGKKIIMLLLERL